MTKKVLYAECADDCFRVEGTNKKELVGFLKTHVKKQHGMVISSFEAGKKIISC